MEQNAWSSVGVDCSRHPNWIWLPLFYQLPKELLEGKSEYLSLPRCPYDVLHSNNSIDMLNADCFVTFVRTTYAKVVWRFFMVPNKSGSYISMPCNCSDFSTDSSLWQLAYGASEQMREIMDGSSLSLRCLSDMPASRKVAWVPLKDYYRMVSEMTTRIVREQNWQPAIDYLWENLTLEDFSDHNSKKKIDAYRKWHHTRTKVGRQMLSYEAMLEQAEDGGYSFDLADTSMEPAQFYDKYIEGPKVDEANEYHGWAADGPYDEWLEKRADIYYKEHSEFLKILKCSGNELSVEDRQVLALRNERFTVSRIAQIMGYKSHAAVTNRLKRVEAYCSNEAATAKATRGSPFYSWRYRCWIRIRRRALMRDLYVTNGFTSCRYCLREGKPAKRDNRCRTYRSGTICAACDHSHMKPMRSKLRPKHTRPAKDVREFVCRWYNFEWH